MSAVSGSLPGSRRRRDVFRVATALAAGAFLGAASNAPLAGPADDLFVRLTRRAARVIGALAAGRGLE